jgi:hypothetical protein
MSSAMSSRTIPSGSRPSRRSASFWPSYSLEPTMALAKIVGFEVTPLTASSSMRRASSPVSSIAREI